MNTNFQVPESRKIELFEKNDTEKQSQSQRKQDESINLIKNATLTSDFISIQNKLLEKTVKQNLSQEELNEVEESIEKINNFFEKTQHQKTKKPKDLTKKEEEIRLSLEELKKVKNKQVVEILKDLMLKKIDETIKHSVEDFSRLSKKNKKSENLIKQHYSNIESLKNISKIIKLDIPIDSINNSSLDSLFFEEHLYERIVYFNHKIELNQKKELLFSCSNEVQITEQDLIPFTDKEINEKIEKQKKSGKKVLINSLEKGKIRSILINPSEISMETMRKHLILCNIKKIYELNKSSNSESIIRRFNKDGSIEFVKESFEDEDLFDLSDFVKHFFDEEGNLNSFLPIINFPEKKLTIKELIENQFITPDGKMMQGVQYLGSGFVRRDPIKWKFLMPFRQLPPEERPPCHVIDIVTSFKSENIPSIQGHAYVRLISPSGEVYNFGLSTQDVSLAASKGVLFSPDTREFVPKKTFHEVTGRYELTQENFGKLIRYIESIKSYDNAHASETGIVYQNLTSNCANFAAGIRDFALKELQAKPVKYSAPNQIKLSSMQLKIESVKSRVIRFLITWAALFATQFEYLKKFSILGFELSAVDKGVAVENYKNYGSIADEIKKNRFTPFLCRDLAIEILKSQEFEKNKA